MVASFDKIYSVYSQIITIIVFTYGKTSAEVMFNGEGQPCMNGFNDGLCIIFVRMYVHYTYEMGEEGMCVNYGCVVYLQ